MDYHASPFHISTYITPLVSILCCSYCNYLINGMIFDAKYITCEICTLIICITFTWKFSKHKKNSATYHNIFTYFFMQSACYFYPLITNIEYRPTDFCKKFPIQNLIKIRPGGTTLFRINRHMIKQQVIVALFNSANAPKPDAYFSETLSKSKTYEAICVTNKFFRDKVTWTSWSLLTCIQFSCNIRINRAALHSEIPNSLLVHQRQVTGNI